MSNVGAHGERVEALVQMGGTEWLSFVNPVRVVSADVPADVFPALQEVERAARVLELHAVGFVSYEAGAGFGLPARKPAGGLPLAWFALFESGSVRAVGRPEARSPYRVGPIRPSLDRSTFDRAFSRIKQHLAQGDTYQANFTFRMLGKFEGEPLSLFADLVRAQQGGHSAYLSLDRLCLCSASPELFFARDGNRIAARPMKGTARRGRTPDEDRRQEAFLRASPKERAENVMIVDMVRNDLGRIAEVGSVTVPELFSVERYPNVWQMTSLVSARSAVPLAELFEALHPSASVTGAPKVRTMEILSELEAEPRGVYTGAIGYVRPDGRASFNVAIRTAVVDRQAGTVEFGVGSGIVWDSDPTAEYEECVLKSSVLGQRTEPFELLETIRWTPEAGFFLLDRHVERLRSSAKYFGFDFQPGRIGPALDAAIGGANCGLRVRLLLAEDGRLRTEQGPLAPAQDPLRVTLASAPVDQADVFLFHKTTRRQVYERARAEGRDYDEVILWNGKRQVTEATTANIVVELDGACITPEIACGLLAGTFREELVARGKIREGIVTLDELARASRIWLINSVHEWREAVLVRRQERAGVRAV